MPNCDKVCMHTIVYISQLQQFQKCIITKWTLFKMVWSSSSAFVSCVTV